MQRVTDSSLLKGSAVWHRPLQPQHPHTYILCKQILVELAELQDAEVGDGTTSVVILAAELLKRANELVRNRIHPTNIISGYRLAMREVGGRSGTGGNGRELAQGVLHAPADICSVFRFLSMEMHGVAAEKQSRPRPGDLLHLGT